MPDLEPVATRLARRDPARGRNRVRRRQIVAAAFCAMLAGAEGATAGGGPENVLLVVNARSWASQTIANHFQALRRIPPQNVHYLDWEGSVESVPVETFRAQILAPTLAAIARRQLSDHIDYIVYSSDFPYAVDLRDDLAGVKLPDQLRPLASLTGVTFLAAHVMAKDPNVLGMKVNRYARLDVPAQERWPTVGFRHWYGWGPEGELQEAGGAHYYLSTLLGFTGGRGNSVSEVLQYLSRAATADGTHPKGTIYFARTNDVRSRTRAPAFDAAVRALAELGVRGEIISETMPVRRNDVQGAMLGAPNIDWAASGSTIQPGAICEHLTSSGGILQENGGQTPLTEFLRYGAAGSSGAVTEPYSMQQKFPLPSLQVHYARGSTLAEAFYQSIQGPYQLLIVGDPLCRPWANIPQVSVAGLPADGKARGVLKLTPTATIGGESTVDRFELYLDGIRRGGCLSGESLDLDTTRMCDGYHELRIVALENSDVESQGRFVGPLIIDNHGRTLELALESPESKAVRGEPLRVVARAQGARGIVVVHNTRLLGQITGEAGTLDVATSLLGTGTVSMQALAIAAETNAVLVQSAPLTVQISAGTPLPALVPAPRAEAGIAIAPAGSAPQVVSDTARSRWLSEAGVQPEQAYTLRSVFEVPVGDVYQFQVSHRGPIVLSVDGRPLYESTEASEKAWNYLPVALAAGWHRLLIEARPTRDPKLEVRFGGRGTRRLASPQFQHE